MSNEAMRQPPQYAERDLLSAIGILQTLLARPGQSDDRRARWRANLNRARMQLEAHRAGGGEARIKSPPATTRA